jgi:hypothetical protein
MQAYADNIVTFGMLLRGYANAFERFSTAASERDEVATFVPLFEALNWAVALDERCARHWAPEGEPLGFAWRERVTGAEVMRGVRWVRNGVQHQWSEALVVVEGRQYPKRYPVVYHEWVWRRAGELPDLGRQDASGEATYGEHLQDRPAEVTLGTLGSVFDHVWRLLELPATLGVPEMGFQPTDD